MGLIPRGLKRSSWSPFHIKKKKSGGTYIDFHDMRILWEWEDEEEEKGEEEWIKAVRSRCWINRDHLSTVKYCIIIPNHSGWINCFH